MDAATIKRVLENPDQELVPFALVKRIANASTPSEYRGMKALSSPRPPMLLAPMCSAAASVGSANTGCAR